MIKAAAVVTELFCPCPRTVLGETATLGEAEMISGEIRSNHRQGILAHLGDCALGLTDGEMNMAPSLRELRGFGSKLS